MKRCWVLVLVLLLTPGLAGADLFEDAVRSLTNDNLEAARLDYLGRSLQGALSAAYPRIPQGTPLLHDWQINTPCGGFGFGAGIMDSLAGMMDPERLGQAFVRQAQSAATTLIGAAISQLPMVSACYLSPTICDVVKQVQNVVNRILHGKLLTCAQAENMLAGVGMKISGANMSRCLSEAQAGGMSLIEAEFSCAGGGGPPTMPTLIRGSLQLAGASPDIEAFAYDVLGEIGLSAGTGADIDVEAPSRRLHDLYETERERLSARVRDAAAVVGTGSALSAAKHRGVSLPGLAMPYGVLRALHQLRETDPQAYANYEEKVAAVFTMLRLSWQVNELRDLLEEGVLDNPQLSEAEVEMIRSRLVRLERERDRFFREQEQLDHHARPLLQQILADFEARGNMARGHAVGVGGNRTTGPARFGDQTPMGHGY